MQLDGHAHVFHKDLPMSESRRYTPSTDALITAYLGHLKRHGFHGGILVQPSFLGFDNSHLLEILDENRCNPSGFLLFGVCMLAPTTEQKVLSDFADRGIIGLRLNCVGCDLPELTDAVWQTFFSMLSTLGWHLEVHVEHHRLITLLRAVPSTLPTIIDHFCLSPDAEALEQLLHDVASLRSLEKTYVKISAPYRLACARRTQLEPAAFLSLLAMLKRYLGMDHLIWGSDWPFTQHEDRQTYDAMVAFGRQLFTETELPFATFPAELLPDIQQKHSGMIG